MLLRCGLAPTRATPRYLFFSPSCPSSCQQLALSEETFTLGFPAKGGNNARQKCPSVLLSDSSPMLGIALLSS